MPTRVGDGEQLRKVVRSSPNPNPHQAAPAAESDTSPLGDEFIELSLLEPHKNFQNSFTIFQRRPAGWAGEPLHTMYP